MSIKTNESKEIELGFFKDARDWRKSASKTWQHDWSAWSPHRKHFLWSIQLHGLYSVDDTDLHFHKVFHKTKIICFHRLKTLKTFKDFYLSKKNVSCRFTVKFWVLSSVVVFLPVFGRKQIDSLFIGLSDVAQNIFNPLTEWVESRPQNYFIS